MPETNHPLKVFLCHARDDKLKTRELYRYLRKRGIQPWLDAEDLFGGQDWRVEIPKAIKASDAIIICLSKNSINKEGFVQAEITFALEKALEIPQGRIFIIPVRFEDCEVPDNLERFHWVDLFEDDGFPKLMRSLKTRAGQLERATVQVPQLDESSPNLSSASKVIAENAQLETEELEKEKTSREMEEREAIERVEIEQNLEVRDVAKPEEKNRLAIKPKRGGQIIYWLGATMFGVSMLILGVVLFSSLNKQFKPPSLTPSAVAVELTTTPLKNKTETPQVLFSSSVLQEITEDNYGLIQKLDTFFVGEDITDISLSPDNQYVAVSYSSSKIEVWNLSTKESVLSFDGDFAAFSPNGQFIGIAGSSGVSVYDFPKGALVFVLNEENSFFSILFSPNSEMIAAGGEYGEFYVWSMNDRSLVESGSGLGGNVNNLAFSGNGNLLALASLEKNFIWSFLDSKIVRTIVVRNQSIEYLGIALDESGETFFTNIGDGKIIAWRVSNAEKILTLTSDEGLIADMEVLGSSDTLLLVTTNESQLSFWEIQGYSYLMNFERVSAPSVCMDVSQKQDLIAIGDNTGFLTLWGIER
ncbi:MAG: TIR domain-containing protein [Anaerolineales bacterium]